MSQLELFEERAAIMQHDGGLTKQEAEHAAALAVVRCLPLTQEQAKTFQGLGWSAGKAIRFLERGHA